MRVLATLLAATLLAPVFATVTVTVTALPAASEEPERQPHRLWDDGGTLDWRTRIEDAMTVAKERRRLIFVEWGRES